MDSRLLTTSIVVLVATVASCDFPSNQPTAPSPEDAELVRSPDKFAPGSGVRPICDADNGGLTLPSGFCALVVHDAL
jgi:hypothetical protein